MTPQPPALKRGSRFRAYPGRKVRYGSGPWIERPVYVVTSVRIHGPSKVIYYRYEASPDRRAEAYATVECLFGNGLEILPADAPSFVGEQPALANDIPPDPEEDGTS